MKIMDNELNLYFVLPDGGIGNKAITFSLNSIEYASNNGFVIQGCAHISGKRLVRGKFIDDVRIIKIFYESQTKQYYWINNTYKVVYDERIRATNKRALTFPKGDKGWLLENSVNEIALFNMLPTYNQERYSL